ncbi:hypothetical protein H4R24_003479 [Coemansia sp. RSA 988]|nr:hypothetical protein H4R24_003479 [Coemansia sp. RSA 988]
MSGEQYSYGGTPPAPRQQNQHPTLAAPVTASAGEQYGMQSPTSGVGAGPVTTARTSVAAPPQTAGVSASASAARGYGALLNTQRHPHSTFQGRYVPQTGPMPSPQQQPPPPPPLPQHYAVGAGNPPRRLSNAASDPSDRVHAGPVRAGPANNHHDNSSGSDTSEDEIELLKRAMGSDQWALQRQRMRKEQLERRGAGSSEDPGSPATQNTSLSAAAAVPPAPPRHTTAVPPAPLRQELAGYQQGYQQGHTQQGYRQSHTQQEYVTKSEVSPQIQHNYTAQFRGYPQAQSPQHAQQQGFGAAYDGHQLSPKVEAGPSSAYAYPASSLAQQSYAQAPIPGYTHWQHGQPLPQRTGATSAYPPLATINPFMHGTMAPGAPGPPVAGVYPSASSAGGDGSGWNESASVRSNDQMSGTVTDASGYSQAYWAHRHQSPTLMHAQTPLRAATDSPLERKMAGGEYQGADHRRHPRPAAGPYGGADPSRAQGPGTAAVATPTDGAGSGSGSAAGPQLTSSVMPFSYSASALAPMREMQEQQQQQQQDPVPSAEAAGPPSALAIQSLLNSTQDGAAFEPARFFGSDGGSDRGSASTDGAAAIHQHIAKENARFRRQSGASGQAPAPAHSPRPQALRQTHVSPGNPDSSPNSHSSYHSAGYSTWLGRADTVMDYATAKQSFSSTDDPVPESSRRRPSAYHTDTPVPALPAPYAAASAAEAIRDFEATMPAAAASEDNGDHKPTVLSPDHSPHPSPASLAEVPSTDFSYYNTKNRASKPVSVLVQVGDDSQEDSVDDADAAVAATVPSEAEAVQTQSPEAESSQMDSSIPESPVPSVGMHDVQNALGRKATMESIDNVLEYYHTHSAPDDDGSGGFSQETSSVGPSARPSPFDLPQHSHHPTNHGSSLVSLHRTQTTPPYQRTSLSSPVDKATSCKHPVDTTLWPEMPSAGSSPRSLSPKSQPVSAAAVGVFGLKMATDLPPAHPRDDLLPADSGTWQQPHGPVPYADIYSRLERLSEPDDLLLPPSSAVPDHSQVVAGPVTAQQQNDILAADDDDGMLQMETLDGVSVLSDIIDQGFARRSDCGYSNSNDSTDSFGEPIEGESGMLSKSLLDAIKHSRSAAPHTGLQSSASQLVDAVAHAAITQPSADSPQCDVPPSNRPDPPTAAAHADPPPPADMPHSMRTNASTLTGSTTAHDEHHSAASVADSTLREKNSTRAATSAPGPPTIPPNCMPLEIMELSSELELALAREQEDYYSDNDAAPPTLDPTILQNLGRAVHQQCLLQRQQVQRRKSNMQLGLTTATSTSHDESSVAASASPSNLDATLAEPHYDSQELALHAMLEEVSLYFTQSGLSLVFPFSAKWINWLTRHPDRPFPWRKDPEDELARAAMRDDDDDDDDDVDEGVEAETQSEVSSFGGEPPVMSRPLPPDDVLSIAMIPMSKRRPARVTDFVAQEKRKGINAHWQYYSVINQIIAVASSIHRTLLLPEPEADHSFVAHQLAALYQFLGGDFKKYKLRIEQIFGAIRQGLDAATPADVDDAEHVPKVLGAESAAALREMMASIIIDALYSMNRVAPVKDQPPNTPTGTGRARQDQHHAPRGEPVSYALSTLKGLPTQPIIRYLTKEMRVVNAEMHQRRRHQQHQQHQRGLAHNLSRNNSMSHLCHPQYMYQAPPPVPPLPLPAANSTGSSDAGPHHGASKPQHSQDSSHNHQTLSHYKQHGTSHVVDSAVAAMLSPTNAGEQE